MMDVVVILWLGFCFTQRPQKRQRPQRVCIDLIAGEQLLKVLP